MATIKLKRIAVHETVYQQLKNLGKAGDSFNDVGQNFKKSVYTQKGGSSRKKGMKKNYELVDTNLL
ncbi:MAG TPA: hypothetical protein VFP49_07695 [Nitrososphaeraceae archaeon]|nr:hypothetical protein [Nitrososphaeraceae archaeon]